MSIQLSKKTLLKFCKLISTLTINKFKVMQILKINKENNISVKNLKKNVVNNIFLLNHEIIFMTLDSWFDCKIQQSSKKLQFET